jgi:hypothetical protein
VYAPTRARKFDKWYWVAAAAIVALGSWWQLGKDELQPQQMAHYPKQNPVKTPADAASKSVEQLPQPTLQLPTSVAKKAYVSLTKPRLETSDEPFKAAFNEPDIEATLLPTQVVTVPAEVVEEVPQPDVKIEKMADNQMVKSKVLKLKNSFKIVHANELPNYQRAELAEARATEARKQGFVVINWKAGENQSEQTLLSFLKNKSAKAD